LAWLDSKYLVNLNHFIIVCKTLKRAFDCCELEEELKLLTDCVKILETNTLEANIQIDEPNPKKTKSIDLLKDCVQKHSKLSSLNSDNEF
jgi:hypothetical protein